jgi:hypothetical protein
MSKFEQDNLPIPLHEPPTIWRPLVKVFPAQKFMKLSREVCDFASPASDPIDPKPSEKDPVWTASASSVKSVALWSSVVPVAVPSSAGFARTLAENAIA